jgi:hypothetical protein
MAQNFDLDLFARDLAEDALDGRPFAPRAALDAIANCGEQLLRPIAQGLLYEGVSLVLAQFGSQCTKHRHQDLGLHARLVQEGYLRVHEIVVDDAAHSVLTNQRRKSGAFVIARIRRGDSVAVAANPMWIMTEVQLERRLAAILAADVAGYSRRMGAHEVGTIAALKAHRREIVDPAIAAHRGRIVKTTGDGILVEFASVDMPHLKLAQRVFAQAKAARLA